MKSELGKDTTMKNLFKLIISLFVCGLVLLTGCTSTPKSSLPSDLKAPNTNYPNKITILAPGFFSGAAVTDPDKQQWLDEMSARYGVQFDILTNYTTDSGEFDHTATDQVHAMLQGDTTFKGIFSCVL